MAKEPLTAVLDYLRKVRARQELHDLPDGDLLERFRAHRDEAAIAVLVCRHGPMVLSVCQRVLGDAHNAEDAFQATFMVLVRRAVAVRRQAPLSSWLYGVARRVALKARAKAAARQNRQRELTDMPRADSLDDVTWQELRSVLDEEIGRLPQKCQTPIVLCYLEGKSHDQAARELGWPKTTLESRLTRGRELLRQKLVKRGVTLSTGALATALTEKTAGAAVGAMLTINTAQAAVKFAAGKAVAGSILSTQAITLAEEVMKGMIAMKVKQLLLVVVCSLALGGVGLAGYHGLGGGRGDGKATTTQVTPPQKNAVAKQKKDAPPALDLHGDPLPMGAVARLGQDRWLHQSAQFAAFLPDGKSVLTVSEDQTIRVWEFPSGKEIRRTSLAPPDKSLGVAFGIFALTKDGKTIATSQSALEADGKELEISLHDVATGKRLPGLKTTGLIWALAFSPDSEHLVSTEMDGTIRIWDWAKAKEVRGFGGQPGKVVPRYDPIYAPDGKSIVTVQMDLANFGAKGFLEVWNPATGTEVATRSIETSKTTPAFSPDGKTLAYASGKAIVLMEAATGKEMDKLLAKETFGGVVFGKDGAKLYATYGSGLMEWDVATKKVVREYAAKEGPGTPCVSPDGNSLLYGRFGPLFLDLAGGKEISAINHSTPPLRSLQFSPDGKILLTNQVRKWEPLTGKDLGLVVLPPALGRVTVSPDGALFAAELRTAPNDAKPASKKAGSFSKVLLLDAASGKELGQVVLDSPIVLFAVRFSPDNKILAVSRQRQGRIELYDVPSGRLRHTLSVETIKKGEFPVAMIFSPDGKTLAACADWNTIGFWDTTTGQRVGSLPLPKDNAMPLPNDNAIKTWAFSPDGRSLALDLGDGTIVCHELATNQPRCALGLPLANIRSRFVLQPDSTPVAFSPDGKSLAQAGHDRIVHLWDIATGKKLAAFKGHAEGVTAVAFSPDGKTVASASDDSTAMIWDVSNIARPTSTATALKPDDLEKHWQTLAETDAVKAWTAISDLVAAPKQTVPFVKNRVKPAAPLDMKLVEELIHQLDDEQFKVRDKATNDLLKIGERIVPALGKALAANPPLETKQRLEELRGKLTGMILQGERLRDYRAVEVLELIGTPEARQVLQTLAKGAPGALVTISAHAALER